MTDSSASVTVLYQLNITILTLIEKDGYMYIEECRREAVQRFLSSEKPTDDTPIDKHDYKLRE
jgi:hypothetical protein